MEMEKSLAYRAALQGNSQQVGDSQKGLGTQWEKESGAQKPDLPVLGLWVAEK